MNATSAFHALNKKRAQSTVAPRWAKGVALPDKEVGGDATSELEESVALGKQEQSFGKTGEEEEQPQQQSGSCFSVVSSAVRKGKGRGKGHANAAGGYVPEHLKTAEDLVAEAKKQSSVATTAAGAASEAAPGKLEKPEAAAAAAASKAGTAAGSAPAPELAMPTPAVAAPPSTGSLAQQQMTQGPGVAVAAAASASASQAPEGTKRSRWQRRARVDAAAAAASDAVAAAAAAASQGAVAEDGNRGCPLSQSSAMLNEAAAAESPLKRQRLDDKASESPEKPPEPEPVGITLAKLSVSQLKTLARYHSVSFTGCVEKSDMIAAIRAKGLDDTAAQRFDEATSKTSAAAIPAAVPMSEEERTALAEAQEAEARAKAAEEEAQQLKAMLAKRLTSSRKKCAPTLSSIERDLAGKPKGFDPLFPNGEEGKASSVGCRVPSQPTGGVDLRQQPGLSSVAGGPGWDICWDHKRGFCAKGSACKWKHG